MKQVAVFGAGIAGTGFIKEVDREGVRVTLVDLKDYFELPFGAPRALMDPDSFGKTVRRPIDGWLDVERVQGKLATLDRDRARLEDGTEVAFDYAVLATGSTIRGFDNLKVASSRTVIEREEEWRSEHDRLAAAESVVVIGGGPIGVELCGEIAEAFPQKSLTLVHATESLLPALGKGPGKKAQRLLEERGVRVILDQRAEVAADGTSLRLDSGETLSAGLIYAATGVSIDASYMQDEFADTLDDRGQIRVDEYLRVRGAEHIYAIGDTNDVPGMKLGAVAARQASVAAENLSAALQQGRLKANKPMTRAVGLVTVGRKSGVVKLPIGRFDPMIRMKQRDLFVSRFVGK